MRAIFTRDFSYSSRVSPFGWEAKADPKPQFFPKEFIEAAERAGAATLVAPKRATPAMPAQQED